MRNKYPKPSLYSCRRKAESAMPPTKSMVYTSDSCGFFIKVYKCCLILRVTGLNNFFIVPELKQRYFMIMFVIKLSSRMCFHVSFLQTRSYFFDQIRQSYFLYEFCIIAPVIIEMHALRLVDYCVISCKNHSREVI